MSRMDRFRDRQENTMPDDYEVEKVKARGQCDDGHVVVGEFYGPDIPVSGWVTMCPHPVHLRREVMKWEKMP